MFVPFALIILFVFLVPMLSVVCVLIGFVFGIVIYQRGQIDERSSWIDHQVSEKFKDVPIDFSVTDTDMYRRN